MKKLLMALLVAVPAIVCDFVLGPGGAVEKKEPNIALKSKEKEDFRAELGVNNNAYFGN